MASLLCLASLGVDEEPKRRRDELGAIGRRCVRMGCEARIWARMTSGGWHARSLTNMAENLQEEVTNGRDLPYESESTTRVVDRI
jgi:hypothetical protein